MRESVSCDGMMVWGKENEMSDIRWCINCGETVAYDAPPEQRICDYCIEEDKRLLDEEDDGCYQCRGCGEGQFEGTVCPVCHGSGTILSEAHQSSKDAEDDRRADAKEEAMEERRGK